MKLLHITASTRPDKKMMAKFKTDAGRVRTVHFGARGMDDYTKTHDKEQRERYRARHKKDLETGDPSRAGFLAYWILWGDSVSVQDNIRAYKSRYNL
jgi:hypothetical protein